MPTQTTRLNEYSDSKRLAVYDTLVSACGHLYSKGKLQEDKFKEAMALFSDLAKNDPLFLAHFAAWSVSRDGKDQKVLSVFFNALSDGDGLPFFPGAEACKPNLRQVSSALLQELPPSLVVRVAEMAQKKFGVPGILNESRHFTTALKTAIRKYILFREGNKDALEGIRKAGLIRKFKSLYRSVGLSPSDYAVGVLKWNQKDGRRWRDLQESAMPQFSTLTSKQIVEILAKTKLSPIVALSVIPREKITSSVAAALLDNCSGNQAIVLYNWFASNGFLDVQAIAKVFKGKIKQATTAVDRIDTLTRNASAEDKAVMTDARSDRRKAQANTGSLGKIYMHIDASGSMTASIQFAKDKAGIFAECIDNPAKNFSWGAFTTSAKKLPIPTSFKKEGFYQALYGLSANGGTDCFACYDSARKFGANVDVFVTDEGHNCADFGAMVKRYHETNNFEKPRVVIIVKFKTQDTSDKLEKGFTQNGIPVVVMTPEALSESAMVAQSVANAIKGEMAVIDEIMDTELPSLPKWWHSVGRKVNAPEKAKTV